MAKHKRAPLDYSNIAEDLEEVDELSVDLETCQTPEWARLSELTLRMISIASFRESTIPKKTGIQYGTFDLWQQGKRCPKPGPAIWLAHAVEELAKKTMKAAEDLRIHAQSMADIDGDDGAPERAE